MNTGRAPPKLLTPWQGRTFARNCTQEGMLAFLEEHFNEDRSLHEKKSRAALGNVCSEKQKQYLANLAKTGVHVKKPRQTLKQKKAKKEAKVLETASPGFQQAHSEADASNGATQGDDSHEAMESIEGQVVQEHTTSGPPMPNRLLGMELTQEMDIDSGNATGKSIEQATTPLSAINTSSKTNPTPPMDLSSPPPVLEGAGRESFPQDAASDAPSPSPYVKFITGVTNILRGIRDTAIEELHMPNLIEPISGHRKFLMLTDVNGVIVLNQRVQVLIRHIIARGDSDLTQEWAELKEALVRGFTEQGWDDVGIEQDVQGIMMDVFGMDLERHFK